MSTDLALPNRVLPFARRRRAHLIGAAGSGMRALHEVLVQLGWQVTGSDPALERPEAGFSAQHQAENVTLEIDLVVASDAVPEDNCERRQAQQLGLEVIRYSEMLGRLMEPRQGMAVAGTHGKSTTTAMAGEILEAAGEAPTVVVGAAPLSGCLSGRAGVGQTMLVEACEYRSNFLSLAPRYAAILDVEPDHFDCFPSLEDQIAAFTAFVAKIPADGYLVFNANCPNTRQATQAAVCTSETFGQSPEATWQASQIGSEAGYYHFELQHQQQTLGRVRLGVPGRHQVSNALAAAAVTTAAGAPVEAILTGLSRFAGLERRLELVGCPGGVAWFDDYAHHPTEVIAGLTTLREIAPLGRIWCIFQPHQASRTSMFLEQFADSLSQADRVGVLDVYHAREEPAAWAHVQRDQLASAVGERETEVLDVWQPDEVISQLEQAIRLGELTPGDIIITMGAGDVSQIGMGLVQRFSVGRLAG